LYKYGVLPEQPVQVDAVPKQVAQEFEQGKHVNGADLKVPDGQLA